MNRPIKWTFGMTTPAIAALAVCLMLMPAADAAAGSCFCLGLTKTKTFTGVSSSDCDWARMDAYEQAGAWASCGADGFCVFQPQELGCALEESPFNFGLIFTWQCRICF